MLLPICKQLQKGERRIRNVFKKEKKEETKVKRKRIIKTRHRGSGSYSGHVRSSIFFQTSSKGMLDALSPNSLLRL